MENQNQSDETAEADSNTRQRAIELAQYVRNAASDNPALECAVVILLCASSMSEMCKNEREEDHWLARLNACIRGTAKLWLEGTRH